MLHHLIIFLPLAGIILDSLKILPAPVGRFVMIAVFLVGLAAAVAKLDAESRPPILRSALCSLAGALATFCLSINLGLGAVVASGLVGLVGAQILKGRDQVVMYLGAFVGMSSLLRFPTYLPLILAGLLGGIYFELLDQSWGGVGGRLGTLAAAAGLTVLVIVGGA